MPQCPDASLASTSGFLTRFCASLPPDLRVSLLNCASRELAASVQRCYRLGDGWAVLIAADASEARQIAMQIALRRRFPLLQTEGCRALTRSPVFYGDRETFADVERWAWTSLLTRDSFCAVERTHRPMYASFGRLLGCWFTFDILISTISCPSRFFSFWSVNRHSELLHRAAIAPALPLPASAPTDNAPAPRLTELINMYAMDAEQLEAEIAHDRTHGRLPTAVCLQVGGDRSVAHLSPHGDAQSDVPRPLRGIIPRWASASSGEFHVTPAWSGLEDGATICESEGRHTPVSQPDDVLVQSLVSDELRRASAAMGDACFWQDQAEDIRQLCDRNNMCVFGRGLFGVLRTDADRGRHFIQYRVICA